MASALFNDSGGHNDDAHVGLVLGQPLVAVAPESLQAVVRGGIEDLVGVQVRALCNKQLIDQFIGFLN